MEAPSKRLRLSEKRLTRQNEHVTGCFHTMTAMINDPEYSDLVFVCKDGERVHSCRMVIMARSHFFKTMLSNGMAESNQAEISLPEISSRALLHILNFLYTGVIFVDEFKTWTEAFEVLAAAKFVLLEEAAEIVWDYLEEMAWATKELPEEKDLIAAAHRLSVAMRFQNLWDDKASVPRVLCKILSQRPLEPLHLVGLSMKALLYTLSDPNTKMEALLYLSLNAETRVKIQAQSVSFKEYLKLRTVILWCICKVAPKEAVEASITHLPRPYFALRLLEEPRRMQRHRHPIDASRYVKSILSRSGPENHGYLQMLLSTIDLRRVHPELLLKVVEPLGIFPLSKLKNAYRLHSIQRRPQNVAFPEFREVWEHSQNWYPSEDGFVIYKLNNTRPIDLIDDGFARCTIPLCRPYGIYEWDVLIETPEITQPQLAFPVIGIIHELDLQTGPLQTEKTIWDNWHQGWAFRKRVDGQCYVNRGTDGDISVWQEYGEKIVTWPYHISVVRVHLNMSERSCWFSYNGQEIVGDHRQLVLKNMPRGVYFPAVSFVETRRIQIRLVRGFDIL